MKKKILLAFYLLMPFSIIKAQNKVSITNPLIEPVTIIQKQAYKVKCCDTIEFKNLATLPKNILVPKKQFNKISRNHFSVIAGGGAASTPGVSNVSLDLLEAKFDIKGSYASNEGKFLFSLAVSGDKEGTSTTLFEDKKTGGKFSSAIGIGVNIRKRYYFLNKEKNRIDNGISKINYKYRSRFLEICNDCIEKDQSKKCDAIVEDTFIQKYLNDSICNYLYSLKDLAANEENDLYLSAKWSSFYQIWISLNGSLGGEKVYSAQQTYNYIIDSVITNKLNTGHLLLGLNYFYYNNRLKLNSLMNAGFGYEKSNNLVDLEKFTVTESSATVDTIVRAPSSQKRDFSTKYDAFNGKILSKDNFLAYFNWYCLFGKNVPLGFHFGVESRNNLNIGDRSLTSLTLGILTSAKKKDDSKTNLTVELFYKVNGTANKDFLDFGNDKKSFIGLNFSIPIVTAPIN